MSSLTTRLNSLQIACIVPCHNEEAAVGKVVRELRHYLPGATVYVYDNHSTDHTAQVAAEAGAVVRHEYLKGKGNVVRRAFSDIDADVYLLVDGDDTYDVAAAPAMIQALIDGPYDHVLGVREQVEGVAAYRPAHEQGNAMLNRIVARLFGENVQDMLSGFRVFSRRFVKSFPAVSREFEIETELTVHCLALRVPQTSMRVGFRDRPVGSESKLRTYRDGWKILRMIIDLTRHERPIFFYGLFSVICLLAGTGMMTPVFAEYLRTGQVPRFPTLILGLVAVLTSCIAMFSGLILDGIRKSRHENSRLNYLQGQPVRLPAEVTAFGDPSARERLYEYERGA